MKEAIHYIFKNPSLSFHHVAVKFKLCAYELKEEYAKAWRQYAKKETA